MPTNTEKTQQAKKSFFSEVKSELKKVHWPSKQELSDHTATVIALVIVTGLFIYLVDTVASKLVQKLIGL